MENWKLTAMILCTFGLFREFRPSEPFFIEYANHFRCFPLKELVEDILPSTTFAAFGSLLVFLFITDSLRYKPIVIFGAISFVASWAITIWWYDSYHLAIIRQVVNAVATSSELAYFTYMYANVDRSHYKMVTSCVHSALHAGQFLGGLCGQLLFSYNVMNFEQLNYISFGSVAISLFVALMLPKVRGNLQPISPASSISENIHSPSISNCSTVTTLSSLTTTDSNNVAILPLEKSLQNSLALSPPPKKHNLKDRFLIYVPEMWTELKLAYSNRYVLKWSIWWATAMALYFQVKLYAEPLWFVIQERTGQAVYNGAVHGSNGLLSTALGIIIAILSKSSSFKAYGEMYLSVISLVQGGILIIMSQTHDLYVAYVGYAAFETLFEVMIIIVSAEVAEGVKEDKEAFIFGLNTLASCGIQIVLTYVVASSRGFALDIRDSFVIYGIYSGILGLACLLVAIQNKARLWKLNHSHSLSLQNQNMQNKMWVATDTHTE